MSFTISEARDAISKHIVESWVANGLLLDNLLFDDFDNETDNKPSTPDKDQTWARIKIKHGDSSQRSLADMSSKAIFSRVAFIMVQIFAPRNTGQTQTDIVGQLMLDTFEKKHASGCMRFRDTSIREIGIDGSFFNTNVTSIAMYDQLK